MLVYGGEVTRRPPRLLILASVAPMAPRVKRERTGILEIDISGYQAGPNVRNLGCGLEGRSQYGLSRCAVVQLIQEGWVLNVWL